MSEDPSSSALMSALISTSPAFHFHPTSVDYLSRLSLSGRGR